MGYEGTQYVSSRCSLAVGDTLITENGNVLITTIDSKDGAADTQLYNLRLVGDHTYYADGYLVHNYKCMFEGDDIMYGYPDDPMIMGEMPY